ncbi:hypothetical protein ABPG75_004709 [Micractinium tetrahymenae]
MQNLVLEFVGANRSDAAGAVLKSVAACCRCLSCFFTSVVLSTSSLLRGRACPGCHPPAAYWWELLCSVAAAVSCRATRERAGIKVFSRHGSLALPLPGLDQHASETLQPRLEHAVNIKVGSHCRMAACWMQPADCLYVCAGPSLGAPQGGTSHAVTAQPTGL